MGKLATIPTFDLVHLTIKNALVQVYGRPEKGVPDTLDYGQDVPWGDVKIYTPTAWRERGEKYNNDRDAVANLIFEGPVYEAMNYGGKFYDVLWRELDKIGCYFELGNAWNLVVLPREPLKHAISHVTPGKVWPRQETHLGHKVYDDGGLSAVQPALVAAQQLWTVRANAYLAQHGDRGTCVIGAGIAVYYQAKGEHPRIRVVIRAPGGQGSLTWESSVEEVLAELAIAGVDAFYECGVMD